MTLLLCILIVVGAAALLFLLLEWERPVRIDRRDHVLRDLWELLR